MELSEKVIRRRLARPLSPNGKDIEWEHPVLIFLAENGTIPPSEEEATFGALDLQDIIRRDVDLKLLGV
jgi:hypothetical protein